MLPAFINKVLFERSHEHPLTAHSYFRSIPTEIAGPSKPKTATTWRFTGNVCGPLHQSNVIKAESLEVEPRQRYLLKLPVWDFRGGLLVRTPGFHCRGHGFDPWLENYDPAYCAVQPKRKAGAPNLQLG